jgi:hypothetical protein
VTERITRLVARAFRGIPGELEVNLRGGRSLAVLGENGTGKSTIADAVEWYFTGGLEYLAHEGRGVALRNIGAPSDVETTVLIETTGALGGMASLLDGSPTEAQRVGSRETFQLRGRTLADFINRSKGEKWKALSEILGIEEVDRLRLDLQRVRNDLRREARSSSEFAAQKAEIVADRIGAASTGLSDRQVLASIQIACAEYGLDQPDSLEHALDPSWIPAAAADPQTVKAAELTRLAAELGAGGPAPFDMDAIQAWNEGVVATASSDVLRTRLLKAAQQLMDAEPESDLCPLCRRPIDPIDLRRVIRASLEALRDASERSERLHEQGRDITDVLENATRWRLERAKSARDLGMELSPPPPVPIQARDAVERFLGVDQDSLALHADLVTDWDRQAAEAVSATVPAPASPREASLWALVQLVQAARDWSVAESELGAAERASELADRIFSGYQERQGAYVQEILDRITDRVAELYGRLHPGEALGAVAVELWGEKGIELAVDFHGTRQKPPHGVLSESHLNSLAVALFLAMAETFNERLGFLVLDDVVNSFDLDHRGQLAELLATAFEEKQLLVLTHDPYFFDRIVRLAPSWNFMQFTSWSFEEGPRTTRYETHGMLEQARERLEADDVTGAAQKGRRALEELLQEICEGLEAPIAFRRGARNDRREVGELLRGLRRCLKELSGDFLRQIHPLLQLIDADVVATLNAEAHASVGAAARPEVEAALQRIRQLDELWTCSDCGTRVWTRGTPDSGRCRCGRSGFPPSRG